MPWGRLRGIFGIGSGLVGAVDLKGSAREGRLVVWMSDKEVNDLAANVYHHRRLATDASLGERTREAWDRQASAEHRALLEYGLRPLCDRLYRRLTQSQRTELSAAEFYSDVLVLIQDAWRGFDPSRPGASFVGWCWTICKHYLGRRFPNASAGDRVDAEPRAINEDFIGAKDERVLQLTEWSLEEKVVYWWRKFVATYEEAPKTDEAVRRRRNVVWFLLVHYQGVAMKDLAAVAQVDPATVTRGVQSVTKAARAYLEAHLHEDILEVVDGY